jgi:hypothetical protein
MWDPRRFTTLQASIACHRDSSTFDILGYLKRGPLSLVSTIEELLGRNSSGSDLENREYGRGDPLSCPRSTLYPQKLALISPANGGRSAGIIRSQTKATSFL